MIRDQLRIRNDRPSFERHRQRKLSVSLLHPCGKRHPAISFQKHMTSTENMVLARLDYFRKRNFYYSGWHMERWWDSKLRAEEKAKKEKLKDVTGSDDNKSSLTSQPMQDRLRQAAWREVSYVEPKLKEKRLPKHVCVWPVKSLSSSNVMDAPILGKLNITKVNLKGGCPKGMVRPKSAETKKTEMSEDEIFEMVKPYLPIVFEWKKMDPSPGYPQLRQDSQNKCGYYTGS